MEVALYHPAQGYYSSRIKSVGSRGDFTTTSQLSPLLARAIAQQFIQSDLRHLIEVGPGTGDLARAIWKELSFLQKRRTQMHLVEVSTPLRTLQKQALPKVHHHTTIQTALEACSGEAFIYSNELVDAFPVRVFRKGNDGWSELFLSGSKGELKEEFQPVSELPHSTQFAGVHPLGQRIEIHESYRRWLSEWTPSFRGQILTIDYVAPTPAPVTGTLRGYFLHDRLTGANLYQSAGQIDLTADVHFDDLEYWGKEMGLDTLFRKSQHAFLRDFAEDNSTDQYLIDPEGAGGAFEVLLQK